MKKIMAEVEYKGNEYIEYKFKVGEKIIVGLDKKTAKFWGLGVREELTVTRKQFFRNGEHHVGTNKGEFPTVFFYIRENL